MLGTMSVLADHQADDELRPLLAEVPRPAVTEPVPLRDALTEYVAQLVKEAPPFSADLRVRLAGLLSE